MEQITTIDHIGIRVFSLETAKRFYQKLGFEFVIGPVGPEPVAILRHPSGVMINLIINAANEASANQLMDITEKYAGYTHIALRVTDLSAVLRQLQTMGIPITEGPVTFPTGQSLFIRDPDLNVIEFHQEAEQWEF